MPGAVNRLAGDAIRGMEQGYGATFPGKQVQHDPLTKSKAARRPCHDGFGGGMRVAYAERTFRRFFRASSGRINVQQSDFSTSSVL